MSKKITAILGTGSAIPKKVVTNFDISKIVDTSDEWIKTRTGISERRIISGEESSSSLAIEASKKALKNSGIDSEKIGLIITATCTPDYIVFPSTGCLIQHKLGLKEVPAFDLSAACSGFVYALSVGKQFIENGTYEYVLIVGVDCLSRYLNWQDRSTCVLFGDGAGAVILGPSPDNERGIKSIWLGAEGEGAELLKVPAGGVKKPLTKDNIHLNEQFLTMNGPEVYKFAVRIIERATSKALEMAEVSPEELDLFIPHQANIRIIEHAARKLGIPLEKVFINVNKYGNTSAASIPIALDEALTQKKLKKGDLVALVGFGAGLTWGSSVIRW